MKRLFLILAFLFVAVPAWATPWYVATDGVDTYGGSHGDITHPFLTGQFAASNPSLACGDTINFRTGTYDGAIGVTYGTTTTCSAWNSSITMQPYSPDGGMTWESVTLMNTGSFALLIFGPVSIPAYNAYWKIHHFRFDLTGGDPIYGGCVSSNSASFVRFQDNVCTNVPTVGIFVNNGGLNDNYDIDGWEISRNHFYHTGTHYDPTMPQDFINRPHHAIYLTHVENSIIEDNILEDATGYGCQINATGAILRNNIIHNNGLSADPAAATPLIGNGSGGCNFGNGSNNQFYNNLVYYNGANGIQLNSACVDCTAYNNTAWNNGIGIFVFNSTRATVRGNISFQNYYSDLTQYSSAGETITDNFFSSANIDYPSNDYCVMSQCDAMAAAFALHNFVPPAMAPVLDNSPDLRLIFTTDIIGNDRVAAHWDQGAYQVTGVSACTATHLVFGSQPQNATVSGSLGTVTAIFKNASEVTCTGVTSNVTFAINSATFGTLQVTSGTLVKAAVGGIATISTMFVSPTAGSGTLKASAYMMTDAVSNSITISASDLTCIVSNHTFYIDYVDGLDTYSGCSKLTPWKHAPGMNGVTGNPAYYLSADGQSGTCAAICVQAGYRYILKGGVTWPKEAIPWYILQSGDGYGAGHEAYFGVDPTWYTGSSWARPIFDYGGSGNSNHCSGILAAFSAYYRVDNFEFTGLYWDHTCNAIPNFQKGNVFYVFTGDRAGGVFSNNYFHGWSHEDYAMAGTLDWCALITGSSQNFGDPAISEYNVFDGSDVDNDEGNSCDAHWHSPGIIRYNYMRDITNGLVSGGPIVTFNNNTCDHVGTSYATDHDQCAESNNDDSGWYVYNNLATNMIAGLVFNVSPYTGITSYFFNNVILTTVDNSNAIDMSPPANTVLGGTVHAWNNTVGGYGISLVNAVIGCSTYMTACDSQNNHAITAAMSIMVDPGGHGSTSHDTLQSTATASGQGYTYNSTPPFFPTSAMGSTIGAGTSLDGYCSLNSYLSALCSTSSVGVGLNATTHTVIVPGFASVVSRDWTNSGAYQYTGGSPLISSITPNNGVPGTLADILVTGVNTNFDAGTTVPSSSCGTMTLLYWTRYSASSALLTFAIDGGASTTTCTITMTTGGEVAAIDHGFAINASVTVPRVTPRRFRKI